MKTSLFLFLFVLASSYPKNFDSFFHHLNIANKVNNMHTTWKAKAYKREYKPYLGVNLNLNQKIINLKIPKRDIVPRKDLPENYDLRTQFPQSISLNAIHDQSHCGSCWAVSTAHMLSDRHYIHSNGKINVHLSSTTLISCDTLGNYGCHGGIPSNALIYWKAVGLPTGGDYGDKNTCWPYFLESCNHGIDGTPLPDCPKEDPVEPECKKECQPGYEKEFKDDLYKGDEYYGINNDEAQIMTEIYERGSVQANFLVYDDFLDYQSGIYQHITGAAAGGHAIKIIGWGVENGVKYWLCVNSWNKYWGENGTFRIIRGENECHIEDQVVAGIPLNE